MLTSLTYTSLDEFESDYRDALIADAAELAKEHTWWHDSFALSADPKNEYLLNGHTRLLHRYIETADGPKKVDYRDDILMGAVDTLALFEMLTLLASEHEFAWQLFLPADPRPKQAGRIINDHIEPKLFDLIMPELDALDISEKELEDQALHLSLRKKYNLDA